MGVYIKGMEMPKNCFDCPCYHHKVDDGYYDYEICGASGTVFNDGYSSVTVHKDHIVPFKERLDNCPLVPVPPHGRLIDADARVNVQMYNDEFEDFQTVNMSIDDLLDSSWIELEDDPTIIPAEESET